MERNCYLRNVHDQVADGKTAIEKIYGQLCDGPSLPSEHWLSTSQLPRQTSQEYIRFERHILRLCALCGVQGGCET